MTELRAYYFGNLYMSSIQQGIQSLHTTAEMFIKYRQTFLNSQAEYLLEWATDHKSVILKQAGYSSDLEVIRQFFYADENPYPWAYFREEGVADALTCVGIILPEKVYGTADTVRRMPFRKREEFLENAGLTDFDLYIVEIIMDTSLAR